MKKPIVFALFFSILLILFSFYLVNRKSQSIVSKPTLIPFENSEQYPEALWQLYTSTSTPSEDGDTDTLTGTDLVSRQLILDYLNLARSGEASEENSQLLIEKYVDSIPTLISSKVLSPLDLKIVPSTSKNIKNYSEELVGIYNKYSVGFSKFNTNNFEDIFDPETKKMFEEMSQIYRETAESLSKMNVLSDIINEHLSLVNLHYKNAESAKRLSASENDPASGLAGIVHLSENYNIEIQVINNINQYLIENDI